MLPRRAPMFWQKNGVAAKALSPLSGFYGWLSQRRRQAYQQGRRWVTWPPAPVIVIGNISVGGTGKTPLVIWMAERAEKLGYRPGVILRGYGGKLRQPTLVTALSDPADVGDEAVLIARHTGLPVAIAAERAAAAQHLIDQAAVNLVISDDGLQHYAMGRDVEIAVVESARGHGNARCLPAGPLREPLDRLNEVDWVISNGRRTDDSMGCYTIEPEQFYAVPSDEPVSLPPGEIHAVAGIGNPQRFFDALSQLGFSVQPHALGDHHVYKPRDFSPLSHLPVVMTEKDAVKCKPLGLDNAFYLRVKATPDAATVAKIDGWFAVAEQRFQARENNR